MKKMKNFMALLLALVMALSIVGCGKTNTDEPQTPDTPDDGADAAVTVMTHAEFDAAAVDSAVTVETYIQARQGWWEKDGVGVATFYTQADDGAYFLYNMPCSKEDYDSMLVEGAKIRVSGYKAEWSGEVEIIDATCELLEGTKAGYRRADCPPEREGLLQGYDRGRLQRCRRSLPVQLGRLRLRG